MCFTKIKIQCLFLCIGGIFIFIKMIASGDRIKCFVILQKEHWLEDAKTRFSVDHLTVK